MHKGLGHATCGSGLEGPGLGLEGWSLGLDYITAQVQKQIPLWLCPGWS